MSRRTREKCWLIEICENFCYFLRTGKKKKVVRIAAGRERKSMPKMQKCNFQTSMNFPPQGEIFEQALFGDFYFLIKATAKENEKPNFCHSENCNDRTEEEILNYRKPLTEKEIAQRTAAWVEDCYKENCSRRFYQDSLRALCSKCKKLHRTKEASPKSSSVKESSLTETSDESSQSYGMDSESDLTLFPKDKNSARSCRSVAIQTDDLSNDIFIYKMLKNSSNKIFKELLKRKYNMSEEFERCSAHSFEKPKASSEESAKCSKRTSSLLNTKTVQTERTKFEMYAFEKLKSCASVELLKKLGVKYHRDPKLSTKTQITKFKSDLSNGAEPCIFRHPIK